MLTCRHTRMHTHMCCACECTHMHTCMHTCVHVSACVRVCMHDACACACVHVHVHSCIHVYMHTFVLVCKTYTGNKAYYYGLQHVCRLYKYNKITRYVNKTVEFGSVVTRISHLSSAIKIIVIVTVISYIK